MTGAEMPGWRGLIDKAWELLREAPLCDNCLGRMFALLGRGWSNRERGDALKRVIVMMLHAAIREGDEEAKKAFLDLAPNIGRQAETLYEELTGSKLEPRPCVICGGDLEEFIRRVSTEAARLLRERCRVRSFLVAAHVEPAIRMAEEEFKQRFMLRYAESIGSEVKREVGKRVQASTGIPVDFDSPDALLEVHIPSGRVELKLMPLLIRGIYWKPARRVSQSAWITATGVKKYPFSVEEALAPLLRLYGGEELILHASGREDVDVRMLGTGRPFIVEVKRPTNRLTPLREAEERVNAWARRLVEVRLLGEARRRDVREIKEEKSRHVKVYRALVVSSEPVTAEDLARIEEEFRNRIVRQRTPRRVRHRRPDIVRERMVYAVKTRLLTPRCFEALVKCEGGLYVKELVDGDGGDTRPSFADVIKKELYCAELDVVAFEGIG